jgi:RsiW-degrading membrane proteinase PrsW (M82 family)
MPVASLFYGDGRMSFDPVAPSPAFRALPKQRDNSSLIKWALIAVGVLVGMMAICLLALLFGAENGIIGLIIGGICATIPVPIYITMLLWIDRFEPEPPAMLIIAFLWGALIATPVSALFNMLMSTIAGSVSGSAQIANVVGAVCSAPVVEETTKGMILFIFFFIRKQDFDGVIDGIVYAGMSALGFAMTENIEYYGRAAQQGQNLTQLGVTIVIRGILSPFVHPMFTSMTGIGLGVAREARSTIVKVIAPVMGLLAAMGLHALWNGTATYDARLFVGTYFLFMVPVFCCVLGVVCYSLLREGRMVRKNLAPEMQSGVLSVHEVNVLCSVFGRMGASAKALGGGFGGWMARRRFHEAASRLAFHRNRILRGQIAAGTASQEQEALLIAELQQRKSRLMR